MYDDARARTLAALAVAPGPVVEHGAQPPQQPLDVLLFNEAGHVTEFTIGNVVLDFGEAMPSLAAGLSPTPSTGLSGALRGIVTPPLADGLLPGVMRAHSLAQHPTVQEASVHVSALRRAKRVWLINSVRGWVRVRLQGLREHY
jgi:para-aminobenzoate synthetase/4-amino-4-deoxychorismate lyase